MGRRGFLKVRFSLLCLLRADRKSKRPLVIEGFFMQAKKGERVLEDLFCFDGLREKCVCLGIIRQNHSMVYLHIYEL